MRSHHAPTIMLALHFLQNNPNSLTWLTKHLLPLQPYLSITNKRKLFVVPTTFTVINIK